MQDDDDLPVILERGLTKGQEFGLDDHQKGKLHAIDSLHSTEESQWATTAFEGNKIVRRYVHYVF